ncbi:hypothetical protein CANARDRAFT_176648 [[Candida] arabinofermentans NRRL YB-2248]|uniref:Reverse transcriptase Ty1/copia-type domain-containing protein n=1 Tax=[Candida] arabinofermentans NRRL YB-2248 TaxID=983967 RepID=A0A1E4SZ69_9ASCO|nr:hypothetical protein CANARDRAFT_176648 [[Candida] arabinofermentans NRRL YB-2248]
MEDLGLVHTFLGMDIGQHNGSVTLGLSSYLTTLLANYNMLDCNPLPTPIEQVSIRKLGLFVTMSISSGGIHRGRSSMNIAGWHNCVMLLKK